MRSVDRSKNGAYDDALCVYDLELFIHGTAELNNAPGM